MNRPRTASNFTNHDFSRRQFFLGLGGGAATLAVGKAVDNTLLGFGVVSGTNLQEQYLAGKARKRFEPSPFTTTVSGHRLQFRDDEIRIQDKETDTLVRTISRFVSPGEAAAVDEELGLVGSPVEQLVRDCATIDANEIRFEFSQYKPFSTALEARTADRSRCKRCVEIGFPLFLPRPSNRLPVPHRPIRKRRSKD